jgi:TIR domain
LLLSRCDVFWHVPRQCLKFYPRHSLLNESTPRAEQRVHEYYFLDFDKHADIPPGADWEKALYREVEQSEAVIIIQTPNWLESKWCFAEFTQARALGKAIFSVLEAPCGDTLICLISTRWIYVAP